jgi:hypothetical protein
VEWRGSQSAQSLLRDQATRNFANQVLWQSDPDCILLRERFHHLSEAEVRSLAIYAGMTGGVIMTSDDLSGLSETRLRLWKLLLGTERRTCRFPLLGQAEITYERLPADIYTQRVRHEARAADPVLVQVRDPQPGGLAAVFVFNTGEQPAQRTYPLEALGLPGPLFAYDWTSDTSWPEPAASISVRLDPHDGALLFLSPDPIQTPPDRLP